MSYLKIPADFNIDNLERIHNINKKAIYPIKEVYGSIPYLLKSARPANILPPVSFSEFCEYIHALKEKKIDFNYVLNINKYVDEEYNIIEKIIKSGITRFTISNPKIGLILSRFDIDMTISAVVGIDSKESLLKFYDKLKINGVCIKEDLNRNLSLLKELILSSPKLRFETIVNSFCLIDCPFKKSHYEFIENKSKESIDIYGINCDKLRLNDPVEILKSPWVLPSDLSKLTDVGIEVFKISGRELIQKNSYKYQSS